MCKFFANEFLHINAITKMRNDAEFPRVHRMPGGNRNFCSQSSETQCNAYFLVLMYIIQISNQVIGSVIQRRFFLVDIVPKGVKLFLKFRL